jgi:hypothetical protein
VEQPRRLKPDASYSSGFNRNVEWLLGPVWVFIGTLFLVSSFIDPGKPGSDDAGLPLWFPFTFIGVGLVVRYFAFFLAVTRVGIRDGTLYWFAPFRRVKGQAPIADIASIWSDQSISWRMTRTIFGIHSRRPVSIRDRRGIREFVAKLVAQSPDIELDVLGTASAH